MTEPSPAVEDVLDGFEIPDHWSESARDVFREVLTERPDLSGAALANLEQACLLVSTADRLDDVARSRGYVGTGSQGQEIVHPTVGEARQARQGAAMILRGLVAEKVTGNPTNSQRARAAARARWAPR